MGAHLTLLPHQRLSRNGKFVLFLYHHLALKRHCLQSADSGLVAILSTSNPSPRHFETVLTPGPRLRRHHHRTRLPLTQAAAAQRRDECSRSGMEDFGFDVTP